MEVEGLGQLGIVQKGSQALDDGCGTEDGHGNPGLRPIPKRMEGRYQIETVVRVLVGYHHCIHQIRIDRESDERTGPSITPNAGGSLLD
jgi:hypothetical protein